VEERSAVELLKAVGGSVVGSLTVVLLVCVDDSPQEILAVGSIRLHAAELQTVR
jgi:hypothetical protein